jgi:hypothetical protein
LVRVALPLCRGGIVTW